jgi:hypothetical protein
VLTSSEKESSLLKRSSGAWEIKQSECTEKKVTPLMPLPCVTQKVKRGEKMKMQPVTKTTLTTILSTLALVVAIGFAREAGAKPKPPASQATMSIFATGLNNPRGLKFGPDGFLYVAEGGIGGTDPACVIVPEVGPYTGSPI